MEKKNLCIVYPNKSSSSETFIQAHIQNLPCNVFKLYGGWFPTMAEGDAPLDNYLPKRLSSYFGGAMRRLGINSKSTNDDYREKALYNFLKKNNIDYVLAEYGLTGVSVMSVCEKAQIPLTVHFHGFDAYVKTVLEEQKENYGELFKKASKIIVVSNHMRQQLQLLGAPLEKLKVNACGVDTDKFSPCNKKTNLPIFLFTGRFVNKKAPHLVILCFSKVLREIPDAKLIMIGDGGLGSNNELYAGCRQLAKALQIEHAVEFKGSVQNDEIALIMKNSLIFIQHSVTADTGDSEGTPVSMLEACASGLVVIGTRHAGIQDVIIDGETGLLVEEYDLENTIIHMVKLGKNISLCHSMGLKARERIIENYSLKRSIGNLWQQIDSSTNKN